MAPTTASSTMVSWILILSVLSAKLISLAEAGMKGKGGRQGHIIIQNEIKDQNQRIVPIYMPIPIPVPMPMGPNHGGDSTQHHQQHHRHHQQRQGHGGSGDDEGEVKKIYLLQPMPKIQPQLKGGQQHIMGPVQTHIHLPVPMAPQPALSHHRRPQNFGGQQQQQQQQQQGHKYGDADELVRQPPGGHKGHMSVPGHSDMKILPIVVIPPIAPMPPIQLQSQPGHHQHQAYESRLHNNNMLSSSSRRQHLGDSYGGSGGGAAFRDAYAREGRARRHQHEHRSMRNHQRFTDEMANDDYGDYGPPRPRAAASQPQMRTARAPPKRRRHSHHHHQHHQHQQEARRSSGGRESIRDIINDQQQQQQVTFDDELDDYNGEQSAAGGCCGGPASPEINHRGPPPPPRSARPIDQQMDSFSPNDLLEQQQQPPESYARAGARASRLSAQDKAELADYVGNQQGGEPAAIKDPTYYEHDAIQPDRINQRELTGRRLYSSEREALDDDEWWFDSIKSVAHVASPQTSANETTVAAEPRDRTKGLQL